MVGQHPLCGILKRAVTALAYVSHSRCCSYQICTGLLGKAAVCVQLGPIVGGQLSDISLQLCAWFAMVVSLPCIALSFAIPAGGLPHYLHVVINNSKPA